MSRICSYSLYWYGQSRLLGWHKFATVLYTMKVKEKRNSSSVSQRLFYQPNLLCFSFINEQPPHLHYEDLSFFIKNLTRNKRKVRYRKKLRGLTKTHDVYVEKVNMLKYWHLIWHGSTCAIEWETLKHFKASFFKDLELLVKCYNFSCLKGLHFYLALTLIDKRCAWNLPS